MDFNLVNLAISVRTDDAKHLVHRLPLQGQEFAATCRNNYCHQPERGCGTCSKEDSCAWSLIFGQNLSSDPSALKRFQKPPLPFMFTFPSPHNLSDTTVIECGLVVIGHAIPYLDLLLDGFKNILLSSAAKIISIGTRDYQDIIHPLGEVNSHNNPENLIVLSINDLFERQISIDTTLHIQFLSPIRLFEDGRLLRTFDFSRFAKSLLRRVSSLAYYYGRHEFACDYKELSRQSDSIVCKDYHFTHVIDQNRRVTGLIGHGRFCGDFSGLVPFLTAGLYVHAGKGSSFGMGAYEILEH